MKTKQQFYQSWWLFVVLFVVLSVYLQMSSQKKNEIQKTRSYLALLDQEIVREAELQRELIEREQSLTDPAYLELVLMDRMGVVPEGQRKVTFHP